MITTIALFWRFIRTPIAHIICRGSINFSPQISLLLNYYFFALSQDSIHKLSMVRLDSGDASFVVQQLAENPYTIEGRIAGVNLRFRFRIQSRLEFRARSDFGWLMAFGFRSRPFEITTLSYFFE